MVAKAMVPKLRFRDDGGREFPGWVEAELQSICEINPKTDQAQLPESFVYVDLESVEKGVLLKQTVIAKINAPSRAQRVLKNEDVLFQMVRPYQGNNLFFNESGSFVASTGYAQIRTSEDPRFLYHYLHLEGFTAEVMNRCTGTSYPAINSSDLGSIEISFPSKQEQTKIANFLTAVDSKISQLTKKHELLTLYKKGVIQKIFSQELRFKDDEGREFAEWGMNKIGELINEKSKKINPDTSHEVFKCIELEHISQDTGEILGHTYTSTSKSIKNKFQCGDVLFGKLRPYLRKFLKAPFDGVCSTEIWVLSSNKLINGFLYQFIQTDLFINAANISARVKVVVASFMRPRAQYRFALSAL